jgi:hypothetical protein
MRVKTRKRKLDALRVMMNYARTPGETPRDGEFYKAAKRLSLVSKDIHAYAYDKAAGSTNAMKYVRNSNALRRVLDETPGLLLMPHIEKVRRLINNGADTGVLLEWLDRALDIQVVDFGVMERAYGALRILLSLLRFVPFSHPLLVKGALRIFFFYSTGLVGSEWAIESFSKLLDRGANTSEITRHACQCIEILIRDGYASYGGLMINADRFWLKNPMFPVLLLAFEKSRSTYPESMCACFEGMLRYLLKEGTRKTVDVHLVPILLKIIRKGYGREGDKRLWELFDEFVREKFSFFYSDLRAFMQILFCFVTVLEQLKRPNVDTRFLKRLTQDFTWVTSQFIVHSFELRSMMNTEKGRKIVKFALEMGATVSVIVKQISEMSSKYLVRQPINVEYLNLLIQNIRKSPRLSLRDSRCSLSLRYLLLYAVKANDLFALNFVSNHWKTSTLATMISKMVAEERIQYKASFVKELFKMHLLTPDALNSIEEAARSDNKTNVVQLVRAARVLGLARGE